tara:strand:+ start:706 stop:1482 length:777 start_codon:yes stop_codon:yes gene_type:complete
MKLKLIVILSSLALMTAYPQNSSIALLGGMSLLDENAIFPYTLNEHYYYYNVDNISYNVDHSSPTIGFEFRHENRNKSILSFSAIHSNYSFSIHSENTEFVYGVNLFMSYYSDRFEEVKMNYSSSRLGISYSIPLLIERNYRLNAYLGTYVNINIPYSLVKSVSNEQFDERWVDPEFFYSKQNTNYLGGSIHPGLEWSSSSDRKNAVNFTLKIEPIGLQTPITGVRNTGVLGITPFLSNGNRFTLSSQLLLGIVRDFL